VQSVPAPPLLGRRPRRAALVAVLAIAAAVAGVLSLGGESPAPAPAPPQPAVHAAYNGLIGGVPLQQARCVQWQRGSAAEQDRVVGALAYSVGGATPYGPGSTLTPSQSHSLFDRACTSPIAQHWLLYELYIRAAGFRSYVPR
jgi:hypothetical protein